MGLLDGKVAVVTGGGTGIGRAVSLDLARAGAKVVVNDYGVSVDGRDPSSEPANEVVAAIRSAGGQAVASPESVATMAGGQAILTLRSLLQSGRWALAWPLLAADFRTPVVIPDTTSEAPFLLAA